ncbi:hypothetical protein AMST5_01296 [freshwater sediment metagenome]|uniref:Uncharacterized protein n=1 Tax=freshwater sediment metagenome TaxID=556182 RepID=A0AA48LY65_9ZZZZ
MLGTHHVTGTHARLNELAAWFEAEHGVALGLLIIDAELSYIEFHAFQRQGRAVLVVCAEAPADAAGVVLEVGKSRVTAAKTASGEPWAREFDLEAVTVDGTEVRVIKPGKAVSPAPAWRAAAPAVIIAPLAKKPEPKITSKVVVIRARGELSQAMRARWAEQDFVIVENSDDALPKPGEIKDGERRLIQVDGIDQNHVDLLSVANRLRWKAIERGVSNDVVILPAA